MLNITNNQRNENENYNVVSHLTLVKMTIIKKPAYNKCWQKCREKETLLHHWECKLGAATMQNSMKIPSKTKNKGFPGGSVVRNPPANVGDRVQSLVQEDPTYHRATKPVYHNY